MNTDNPTQIHATGEATGLIPAPSDHAKPVTEIPPIVAGIDDARREVERKVLV